MKGGNARHPCPYCLYNKVKDKPGVVGTASHFDDMYTKLIEQCNGAQQYAKECAGIFRPPNLSNFESPLQSFPIATDMEFSDFVKNYWTESL